MDDAASSGGGGDGELIDLSERDELLLLTVDRSSCVGNPFLTNGPSGREGACAAFDELLRVVITLGCAALAGGASVRDLDPDGPRLQAILSSLARSHHARLHGSYRHRDELSPGSSGDLDCHGQSLAGAIYLLLARPPLRVCGAPRVMAGDWAVADIGRRWPGEMARELASFAWPVASLGELNRLMGLPHAAPVALCGCEFTASIREWYSRTWGQVAVSCDERASEVPGPHITLDIRLVVHARVWHDAFFFVPCTHQTLSDTTSGQAKRLDGRTFWGIALFIYCWCVVARRVMMEQPATIIPQYYLEPTQILRPCDVGDDDSKPVHLTTRGRSAIPTVPAVAAASSGHGRLRDFANADERDRWRSSWARFPRLAAAAATSGRDAPPSDVVLNYLEQMELFACRWHPLPVPYDYLNPGGQPSDESTRQYQRVRGRGDGRRVSGVVPYSMRLPTPRTGTRTAGLGSERPCTTGTELLPGQARTEAQGIAAGPSGLDPIPPSGVTGPSNAASVAAAHAAPLAGTPSPLAGTPSPLAGTPSPLAGTSSEEGEHALARLAPVSRAELLHCLDGLDAGDALALHEVVLSHEKWRGLAPDVDETLRRRLRDALAARAVRVAGLALDESYFIDAAALAANCMALVLVALQAAPLILACASGMRVIGYDLDLTAAHRLTTATRTAEALVPGAGVVTYLAGRLAEGRGAAVFTAPLSHEPDEAMVARTSRQRRRILAKSGAVAVWMTLAALHGTPVGSVAACAVWACNALRSEVGELPTGALPGQGGSFRFGATDVVSLVDQARMAPAPTPLESLFARSLHEGGVLRDRLLETGDPYMIDWAEQITPPEMSEYPSGLLDSPPSFTDRRLGELPFPALRPPPQRARLPLMPRQEPVDHCIQSPSQLMPRHIWRRVERWLQATVDDLECVELHGDDCVRERPHVLVVGQADLHDWARGRVYDFRPVLNGEADCAAPLDTRKGLDHTFNREFFRQRLATYPNQHILGFIEDGVIYEADVELQTVLVPHLMSLSKGYASVQKELNRMAAPELAWYTYHRDFPFWPMYSLGEGCVPRKLESRWRRCEEGGGPRKEVCDSGGLRALSLNEASRTYHFPQHFGLDRRPEWLAYLAERQLPATPEMVEAALRNRGTKHPRQHMPDIGMLMRAIAILKQAAQAMGEPVYVLGDDIKDYFNHFVTSAEDSWKTNTIFIDGGGHIDEAMLSAAGGAKLAFIHERRMGFGLHPNSNFAQEFSETLLDLLREDMDAVDDPATEADPRTSVQAWLEQRRRVERIHGGHQRRLYFVTMYCDDIVIVVVGAERALRLIRCWRALTEAAGLIMAIPEKRSIGVWGVWLGALIFTAAGVVAIPKQKVLRATQAIRSLLREGIEFGIYRSLVGLLEHLRCIARLPRRVMHGLYEPHGPEGASKDGPNATVRASLLMRLQLDNWLEVLGTCSGSAVTAVIRGREWRQLSQARTRTFVGSSDAATDSSPPGLGGYMHGFWWRLEVPQEHLAWLHITVLELLATVFSAIIFEPMVPAPCRLLLQMDATSAFYTLARETEKSPVLMEAHHRALQAPAFARAAERIDAGHIRGDGNIAGDAVSRSYEDVMAAIAMHSRVRLERVPVPASCMDIYDGVLAHARHLGRPVKPNAGRPPPPPMPTVAIRLLSALERGLGRSRRDQEDGDGPTLAERLRDAGCGSRKGSSHAAPPAAEAPQGLKRKLAAAIGRSHRPEPGSSAARGGSARKMSAAKVGGVLLASPSYSRERATSRRTADAQIAATGRAADLVEPGATAAQAARVHAAVSHTVSMAELGASARTLDKDDRAWDFWVEFSGVYGWQPIVSRELAVQRPDALLSRLGIFLLWVYPQLVGRGQPDAKPRSALSYPIAIARVLGRDHKLPVPRGKAIEGEAKGLLRSYMRIYGSKALAPRKRQPMTPQIWGKVEQLVPGTRLAGRTAWMTSRAHDDRTGVRLGRVLRKTAHRLGEAVEYDPSEITYLTRDSVSYVIRGRPVTDPTVEQLDSMRCGDLVNLTACASKADQFGEAHCPFPSVLEYDGSETSAAGSIIAIEREQPCHGEERKSRPLFAQANGRPYSYSQLNRWLHSVLAALVGEAVASVLSWHSCRIELACRLRAAGASDALIQLICRWKSPASVQEYAQIGTNHHVAWLKKAERVTFEALRTNNLPALDNSEQYAQLYNGEDDRRQRRPQAAGAAQQQLQPEQQRPAQPTIPPPLLAAGDRIQVLWGDEYFTGTFTSSRIDHAQQRRLHRINYDAAQSWRAQAHWHDLSDEDWRLAT